MFWNKVLKLAKKYWQYIVLFFVGIFTLIFFRRKDHVSDQNTTRDSRDKQLDKIDDIRNEERGKEDQANQKLNSGLVEVEKQYEQQKKELTEKKKEEIKKVFEKYKDDPVGLAKRLSDVTGFKIIMPEE